MSFFGKRMSTIKKRMSFSEQDPSPPAVLRARMQRSRRNTQESTLVEMDNMSQSGTLPRTRSRSLTKHHSQKTMRSMSIPEEFEPLPEEMPDSEEVNRLLELVLDKMAVQDAHKATFRGQTDEKKWQIIKAHKTKSKKSTQQTEDLRSASYWIRKMDERDKGKPTLKHEDALKMQSVLRTAHSDFLAEFIENFAGVKALNRVTAYFANLSKRKKKEEETLIGLIDCYKLLMNNEVGMKGVLMVPDSVRTIATAMDFFGKSHILTEKVVTLLSVACWWDEQGRKRVMEAMRFLKARYREFSAFQTVVFLFEHSDSLSFQAAVATFITTVCNTPPSIELRVGVRNHFYRLDVIKIFDKVLARKPEKIESPEDEQNWETIQTQFEVFVAMMTQDQKDIVHKLIRAADADDSHFDLSNLADSWKLLQKNALKADCGDQLLNVIQALFLVPTVSTLAAPIYESIAKYVFEATSIEVLLGDEQKALTDPPALNFEELGKILKKKIEYDAKLQVFSEREGLVKRQQRLIKVLQKRLVNIQSGKIEPKDATSIEEDLIGKELLPKKDGEKKKKDGVTVDLSLLAGLGLADTSNEIEIMKEREAKLKLEIDELQKKVAILSKGGKIDEKALEAAVKGDKKKEYKGKLDSTGLIPAGIAPGKTLKEPPPVPKKGMPGSLENAPVAVEEKVEAKLPKTGGPPGKGGLEAMLAANFAKQKKKPKPNKAAKRKAALDKLGLPDKEPLKPTIKMTQVFWNVVDPEKLEGTVWPELSDQNVKYNPEELERLFGKVNVEKKKKKGEKKKKEEPELVKLIDAQRRQNVAIALRKTKMSNSEISAAILGADEKVLSAEKLQVFIDTAPTQDELTLLKNYEKEGDVKKLASEEQYLQEMSKIPDLAVRLSCIKTTYTFSSDAKKVYSIIKRMQKAIKEVNESSDLKEILEIVLGVGNYMNGGTARGAAWGFKLDILGNLINVKDALNTRTLMHYLYVLFERNYPHLTEFSLPESAKVVNVSFNDAVGEMNALANQIAVLKQEIKKNPISKKDKFRKKLSPFEVKASKDVENLQKLLEAVRTDFESLAVKYAESGNDVAPNTFFPKLVSFEQCLKRAGAQLKESRQQEARKQLAEEKKQERQTYRKLKKLVEATRDKEGNLDMGIIHAFKSSQSGKTNQVVDRFLEKYRREQERQRKNERKRSKRRN